ncbi:MAG: isoleucine--tRNA ligase [Chlamydiia bacterium]|nr:isoleucine--tRNA ligase [Chlamydiia bacterium]
MFEMPKASFTEREERILKFWKEADIFRKSVDQRKDEETFVTFDGPPFATGLPHYGHILAGTIKDTVLRYHSMQGMHVPRRFGWDCHGLPVENEIEKAKELSGAPSIEAFGIGNFNEECRSIVMRYSTEWQETVLRTGRILDFDDTYRTMDSKFMESVWWVFKQLWDKDLVYEGFKVMPFSAKLGTPLSNFEANLNYRDVDDPSLTVKYALEDEPGVHLLIWTTTPWTLLSNMAVIVHPELDYVQVEHEGEQLILAASRVAAHFKDEPKVVKKMKGFELVGRKYFPPFDLFLEQASENAFKVVADEFVGADDGTGLVHAAPAFGETDFYVCKREGIEPVCPVDQNGRFTSEAGPFAGQFVKDADKEIMRKLKNEGKIFKQATIRHRYPFCWRSDTPLLYKAVSTWFVAVEKIKDRLIAANEQITWVPEHIQKGRFGKWLENARDWAVSRNRFWGTPIPIWRNEDGECIVIESAYELEKLSGKRVEDLHRHFIDEITFEKDGKVYRRIPEVFDCWFESGSMPYAQNGEKDQTQLPAEFIAEGLDQTRGWFYTLMVLSTALFDKPAFKHCIVNGMILAEDGNKMSKRLKNYPEPGIVIHKYGADAVRLFLLNSPAVYADDLRFSERGVELVLRQFLIPLWNAYVFFATYANIYEWKPGKLNAKEDIDRWILSRLQSLSVQVSDAMDRYTLSEALAPFTAFIDQLTNWYIRRCRPRFWADEDTPDRQAAFQTLYTVLVALSKIAAPFIPFLSDAIYQSLRRESDPESVHLCDFPKADSDLQEAELELEMEMAQIAVSMGHALRKENKIKTRQPLPCAHLVSSDPLALMALKGQQQLICDELNVKTLQFHTDETDFVELLPKANFRNLGKKVGGLMPLVKAAIENLSIEQLQALQNNLDVELPVDGQIILLSSDDVQVERKVKDDLIAASQGSITVALDTTLSEELLEEGLAREIVNKLNTMRRNENFEVTDRIRVSIETTEQVERCFKHYYDYITNETLITHIEFQKTMGTKWDLNGQDATMAITKDG